MQIIQKNLFKKKKNIITLLDNITKLYLIGQQIPEHSSSN